MEAIPKYPRTFHLDDSGLPPGDSGRGRIQWSGIVGHNVVLEEKIDGSHSGFFFDAGGSLHALNRGNELDISSRGGGERQFDVLKDWLAAHEATFLDRLEDRFVVYGEWAYAAHSVYYDELPHLFLEFDVLDRQASDFLSTPMRNALLDGLPIASVPVLFQGTAQPAKSPASFVGQSAFKSDGWRASCKRGSGADFGEIGIEDSDLGEGIYGKVEENGRVVMRFKWVRPGFVKHIVEGEGHWTNRNLVLNGLADGVDIFAQRVAAPG